MSETATPSRLRSTPRAIPWSAVAGQGAWLLVTGGALLAIGGSWLLLSGVDTAAIFADPGPRADDAAAALPVGAAVLPGLLLIGLWLRGVLRLRLLLSQADAAPAELVFQQRLVCSVPSRILVSYRFRDDGGVEREARQTVRAASPEGRCLWEGGRGLIAMFDPGDSSQSHLVSERRFADP